MKHFGIAVAVMAYLLLICCWLVVHAEEESEEQAPECFPVTLNGFNYDVLESIGTEEPEGIPEPYRKWTALKVLGALDETEQGIELLENKTLHYLLDANGIALILDDDVYNMPVKITGLWYPQENLVKVGSYEADLWFESKVGSKSNDQAL